MTLGLIGTKCWIASARGTAVITTKLKVWDYSNYVDNENIIFMDNNIWMNGCQKLRRYTVMMKIKKIGSHSLKLINDKYRLEIFNNELENLIENGK